MTTIPVINITPPALPVAAVPTALAEDIEVYTFSYSGPLMIYTGLNALYLEESYSIRTIRFYVATAADRDITLDILCNGTSIYSVKPVIAAGQHTVLATSGYTKTAFSPGDVLTMNITSIGLSLPGADLTATIRLKRLS